MSFLGGLAGSLVGGAFGLLGASKQASYNAKAAQAQIDAERYNYKHRYQWQVEDMRKAGLNPALSYTTSAGSAPGASMANTVDYAGAMTSGANAGANTALAIANLRNIESQTALNSAKAEEARLSIPENRARFNLEVTKSQEEINKIRYQNQSILEKLPHEINKLLADTENALASAQYGNIPKIAGNFYEKLTDFVIKNQDSLTKDASSVLNQLRQISKNLVNSLATPFGGIRWFTNSAKRAFGNKKGYPSLEDVFLP